MATAASQARWRAKQRAAGRCTACGRPRLPGLLRCAWCLARGIERNNHPELGHDTKAHARMLTRSHDDASCCAAAGLTRAELRTIGDELTVDRINSDRGYVRGNMQLLSRRLNRAKWRMAKPPDWEVDRLLRTFRGESLGDFG